MKELPDSRTFYFYRGRVALHALLRALEVGPGDEVLIPAFTCVALPSPIIRTGAQPIYADIDPRTYNLQASQLEERVTRRTRVLIAQHTYGIACDMDAVVSIARKHNLVVIEDACHVWGSRYRGRELGTIGAAAFYSYDPGKPFIIGMGGAALVNEETLRERVDRVYLDFKNPGLAETLLINLQYFAYRITRHPRLFWVVRDLYRLLCRTGVAVATWSPDELNKEILLDYRKGLPTSLRRRLTEMMKEGESVISHHKHLAERYSRGLAELGIENLHSDRDSESVLICYPVQVLNKWKLLAAARESKIELGDWFSSPVHPLDEPQWPTVGYKKGSCPSAETVAQRTITLPCHAGISEREVDRILAFLRAMKTRGVLNLPEENGTCPSYKIATSIEVVN